MALDATVGGANSNSYVDVTYANAFFANRVEIDDWTAVVDKDLALMTETANLNAYEAYGERVSTTQALEWPRYHVLKRDGQSYYLPTEIPKPLKDALCLRALARASPTSIGASSGSASSVKLKIGNSVSYETTAENSSSTSSSSSSGGILGEAGRLLRGLLMGMSGVPVVRG